MAFTESLVVIIMNVVVFIVTVVVIITFAMDIIVFVMAQPHLQMCGPGICDDHYIYFIPCILFSWT